MIYQGKNIVTVALLLLAPMLSIGQVFHFINTSTTLDVTTENSPAHWYIEIVSDISTDTTLRWKSHWTNLPSQWQISFDDQSNIYPDVHDGDSADFTLFANSSAYQKLVIGNILNDQPGRNTLYFDIYDPNSPQDVTTISYVFKVAGSTTGIDDSKSQGEWVYFANNAIHCSDGFIDDSFQLYSLTGSMLYQGKISSNQESVPQLNTVGYVLLKVMHEDETVVQKIRID